MINETPEETDKKYYSDTFNNVILECNYNIVLQSRAYLYFSFSKLMPYIINENLLFSVYVLYYIFF